MSKIVKIIIGLTVIGCIILVFFYVIKQNSSSKPYSQDNSSQDNPSETSSFPKKNEKNKNSDKSISGKSLPTANSKTSVPSKSGKEKNKKLEFISTKIDDNTFRYYFQQEGSKISFSSFISALKQKDQEFFSVFQG